MTYQNDPTLGPGRGYWPSHEVPPVPNVPNGMAQMPGGGLAPSPQYHQSHAGSSSSPMMHMPHQHWNPGMQPQMQYVVPSPYAPAQLYAPPNLMPTAYQTQPPPQSQPQPHPHLEPRHQHQLQHQQIQQPQHPSYPIPQYHQYQDNRYRYQQVATAPVQQNINNFAPVAAPLDSNISVPPIDHPMLVISLAEEFFETAHNLAPSVAKSMDNESLETYQKLIATGLGCLESALKKLKLAPRLEAKVRLRYAGVLYEETDNFMEAEIALSTGITLCERNHFYDLKYAMQFLLAKFIFRKQPKASLKTLDSHIADAQAYHHYPWVYVFRFLRASYSLQIGSSLDCHAAIQHLRSVETIANQQGDRAIYLTACLIEALAHLKSSSPESTEHVQRAIAGAWTYQLDSDARIPQLLGLTHILDVACSLRQGNNPTQMITKLKAMQIMMDEALDSSEWPDTSDIISIPVKHLQSKTSGPLVTEDTKMIVGVGADGRPNLIMSFLNKRDAYAISYLLCGMVLLHRNSSDQKAIKYLRQGLATLSENNLPSETSSDHLGNLLQQASWRGQILCYIHIYMAFCSAATADWPSVKASVDDFTETAVSLEVSRDGMLGTLVMYLTGIYHQGIGDLDVALQIFRDERFNISPKTESSFSSADQVERDIAILAALNSLWILQEGQRQDSAQNSYLLARLEPLCKNHPNKDIETAFNLVMATVETNPPSQLFNIKNYLSSALAGAKATANTQFLCITLNVMCSRFFANVVGEQAEKSAKAACVQARNSGNVLWMSVAGGMLAQCYEFQGKKLEADLAFEEARRLAQRALPKS